MTAALGMSLLFVSLGWPLIAIAAVGMAVHIAVTLSKRRWRRARTGWLEGSFAAVAIYGAGDFYGGFSYKDPEDPCLFRGYAYSDARDAGVTGPSRRPVRSRPGNRSFAQLGRGPAAGDVITSIRGS
ncbi:hypothetical protein WBK31_38090 [Nonomuraea sp. N2-4H]|uniref:hypothetical protein n=1 Tax=Nonomuraea sp. N2-4H TaxID=3128898 RepID=UPI00324AEDEF